MKLLVIIRHGKAEHPEYYVPDFDRKLTSRGKNDAEIIGKILEKTLPEKRSFISSPAKRAIQTARIMAQTLLFPEQNILQEEDLYDGLTTSEFIDLLEELPEDPDTALVFGHNPTQAILVDRFAPEFNGHMPTSCAVGIEFDVSKWSEIEPRQGKILFHYYPKMFR